jgi:hypothetical protein
MRRGRNFGENNHLVFAETSWSYGEDQNGPRRESVITPRRTQFIDIAGFQLGLVSRSYMPI